MKKQKQKEIKVKDFAEMVNSYKNKEVEPPTEANRGLDGTYNIDKARAAQYWFKAAKEQNPAKGFLGVEKTDIDVKTAQDREMLYKGNKNKK